MSDVVLKNIVKKYDGASVTTIKDLNLTLGSGEFVCLLGPSGCGKTTTLRMIAGLEEPTSGVVSYGDRVFSDALQGVFVPAERRELGMMFQSYALWPHMTVRDNIAFGLRMKKTTKAERESRIGEMETLFRLTGLLDRYPSELSGGQQQRVALARMLAVNPSLLLLDEPLSNLDAALRLEMRAELKRLHKALNCTIVFVTHDQFEAMSLATSVVVMNDGDVVQQAPPLETYHHPATQFVAQFMGNPPLNVFAPQDHPEVVAWLAAQTRVRPDAEQIGIRPEALSFAVSPGEGLIEAQVESIAPNGADCITVVQCAGVPMFVLSAELPPVGEGETVWLRVADRGVHSFDSDGVTIAKEAVHAR